MKSAAAIAILAAGANARTLKQDEVPACVMEINAEMNTCVSKMASDYNAVCGANGCMGAVMDKVAGCTFMEEGMMVDPCDVDASAVEELEGLVVNGEAGPDMMNAECGGAMTAVATAASSTACAGNMMAASMAMSMGMAGSMMDAASDMMSGDMTAEEMADAANAMSDGMAMMAPGPSMSPGPGMDMSLSDMTSMCEGTCLADITKAAESAPVECQPMMMSVTMAMQEMQGTCGLITSVTPKCLEQFDAMDSDFEPKTCDDIFSVVDQGCVDQLAPMIMMMEAMEGDYDGGGMGSSAGRNLRAVRNLASHQSDGGLDPMSCVSADVLEQMQQQQQQGGNTIVPGAGAGDDGSTTNDDKEATIDLSKVDTLQCPITFATEIGKFVSQNANCATSISIMNSPDMNVLEASQCPKMKDACRCVSDFIEKFSDVADEACAAYMIDEKLAVEDNGEATCEPISLQACSGSLGGKAKELAEKAGLVDDDFFGSPASKAVMSAALVAGLALLA